MIKSFRPMEQVCRVSHTHLGISSECVAQKIHPIFPIDFLGNDGAGFRPLHIPLSLISRENDALPLPMYQIGRRGETELGIFLVCTNSIHAVVSGIGKVVSLAKLY